MKTVDEIKEKIKLVKLDDRLKGKPALVHINAPLALIQCSLQTQIDTLEWVLDNDDG
jgi:hypothetical protein